MTKMEIAKQIAQLKWPECNEEGFLLEAETLYLVKKHTKSELVAMLGELKGGC